MKHSRFCRILAMALICSLALPLPMAGHAASRNTNADYDNARVHARLNSPERQAAIARAAEMDKAAREEYARGEGGDNSAGQRNWTLSEAKRPQGEAQEGLSQLNPSPSPLALSPTSPHTHDGGDGNSASAAQSPKTGLQGPQALAGEARRGKAPSVSSATTRPKTMTEIMFNAATGMVGLPGLAGSQHDPYDPNADQGLGFHADGTARRADGTTGTNAASAGYNGKRAAAYAGSGLGYSPYGTYGNGLYVNEPGYDPITGQNFRYGDPTNGGRRTMGQGGYGNLDQFDPQRMLMQRGLNYGMGLANSAAEGLFLGLMESPYGGAKARFNFMVDWDGKVNGEGDLLLPWWDSKYTTVYSQFGARTMNAEDSRDRWIGNFGLGQRWYPYAVNEGTGEDAGNLMLGYNAFFDNDFTRSHQRGGVGIEGQYDWFHLASNYYFPLSSWKGSEDFDSNFVKERPAEGWDIRAKGYLPFYRNVALTGAYTQWYGDNVGMFGAKNLEKDPKVWSYGLEYTPVPLVSGFVNQRTTEQGRSDTEFGLRFTYHFQMPWEDQIRHDKVAQLRTVGGSRHEFVDRENRIILEYKAKNNFHVEYLGKVGTNQFKFRIRNGFDKYVAGQQVRVSASGGATLAEAAAPAPATFLAQAGEFLGSLFSVRSAHAADFSQTYTTDGNGEFIVRLDNVMSIPVVLTIQAGNTSQSVTLHEATVTAAYTLEASPATLMQHVAQNVTFTFKRNGVAVPASTPVSFAANANFTGLPAGAQNTDASGQIVVSNLTALASGAQTIQATVEGQTVSVNINATPSAYTLETSPATLMQHVAQNVTFTFKRNGVAVPASTPVSFAANANFTGLPVGAQNTDASGQVVVSNLTALASGTQPISATVDGQTVSVMLTVAEATPVASAVQVVTNNQPADNSSLNEVKVRFLQYTGGPVVADGTTVNWSLVGAPAGITLTAATSNVSGGEGWAEMTLKDGQIGNRDVVIRASYSGTNRDITVHFGAPVLALSNIAKSVANPAINANSVITVDVKFADNTAAISLPASSITWKTRNNASASATATTVTSGTDGTGKASFTATSGIQHVMYVEGRAGTSSQNTTVQFGVNLPAGFIVGPGGSNGQPFTGVSLSWDQAVTYCQNQGGQLPERQNYTVAGGFPFGSYWSRQEVGAGIAWLLNGDGICLDDYNVSDVKTAPYQVVCVQ